jgi:hypothetical protein
LSIEPSTVFALVICATSFDITLPDTTWYVRIEESFSLSARTALSVASEILAKAALFGANTVNGPSPESVSTSPAVLIAVTSVEKSGLPTAVSIIFFIYVLKFR